MFILLSKVQFGQRGFNFLQAAFNQRALLSAEAVERLGHEIVADAETGKRALDALDDGRRVAADVIKRIADAQDLRLKFPGAGQVAGAGGLDQFHVKFRLLTTQPTSGGVNSIIRCHDMGMTFGRPARMVVSSTTGPGSISR